MKRFKFSLEKALKLREHHEKETEIDLGRAVGKLSRIEQAIAVTSEERDMTAAERFSAHNVSDLLVFDRYVQRLDLAKEQLLQEAEQASDQVEEARDVYLEAARDRKVLDKLKERREQEYRKTVYAEETQILDDIASGAKIRSGITG